MNPKRATSQEVAERAGVSRTTVSFVLNGVEGVRIRPETRRRVLQAARELGYVPNEAARSLVSGQSKTLALIICQTTSQIVSDAYIPLMINGINDITRRHGFRLLIDWVEDVSQPDAYVNLAKAKKIDGILLCCPRLDDEQLPQLIKEGFPVVVMGSVPDIDEGYFVEADNYVAASVAVQHLIDLGHQRIACVTNGPKYYKMVDDRLAGYRKALESVRLDYDDTLVRYGQFNPESGYAAMTELLQSKYPPTAVFVASDVVAFGVLAAIRDYGLQVPQDIAVVSFDDVPLAQYVDPPLTTVHVPAIEQGVIGGEMIISLIQGEEPSPKQVILDTELIIRESCGVRLPVN